MGGCPVLGYDVDARGGRLVVNEDEAEQVRAIFALFDETGSTQLTLWEIEQRGWRLKSWTRKTGGLHAGGPFTLTAYGVCYERPIYRRDPAQRQTYRGEQEAIVAPEVWQRVQEQIAGRDSATGQSTEQASGFTQWFAPLRMLRGADGVLVCRK